jgi:hypothetical protein
MNILLIIYNTDLEKDRVFKDRINSIGETFYCFDNMVFVETESSTKDVYERISNNGYDKYLMLVLHVTNEMLGFWGRMKTELWDWLADREEKTSDGMIETYKNELIKTTTKIKMLSEENIKLKEELEDNKCVISNLYQQLNELEKKLN